MVEYRGQREFQEKRLPRPPEIKAFLDEYIIGQERAKKILSVAVHSHYKRVFMPQEDSSLRMQKGNVLLIGPTGTGKTLLAETLARIVGVPLSISDATTLTQAGYVGEDVENVVLRLFQAADGKIEKCERGIIYIDEIDKIGRKNESPSLTRDVSGEGVQQALLKMIEGTVVNVPPHGGRKHPHEKMIPINTGQILFICGGAFEGLDTIIAQRYQDKTIGFGSKRMERRDFNHRILPEDLLKFGMIPEFVGRLPLIARLERLDEDDLVHILREPKDALTKQYERLFSLEGIALRFTEDALYAIAREAIALGTGARGLRSVLEELLLDVMYDLPTLSDHKVYVIDGREVERILSPPLDEEERKEAV
ncbi:MAG: ATP-dependent Clp protease ATP-binding subunit ClpX [Nitrospiria bacterium]